ncbi:MAG TPA: TPM domain-containing protein [Burkholderiales bacterium]|nr:TPM domain-containing protein [Burkholderiales bacterium]
MNLRRLWRHYLTPPWWVRRTLSPAALARIEAAIRESEKTHNGELRFAVESALGTAALLRAQPARERALEVFAALGVWDTEQNNGVLLYLLLADRDIEIVADRGVHAKVGAPEWERICRLMENHFRTGQFEAGVLAGIREISEHLARHYPGDGRANELPDAPIVL